MATPNPLIEESPLPRFSAIEPDHVGPAVDDVIADYGAAIESLVAGEAERTWETVMQPQEIWAERLSRAWAPVSHLHSVKDSPALRTAYGDALERITDFETELGQNRELYRAVQGSRTGPATRGSTPCSGRSSTTRCATSGCRASRWKSRRARASR